MASRTEAEDEVRKRRLYLSAGVFWGSGVVLFAWLLKRFVPERFSSVLQALTASEAFHIFAHSFLYGTLSLLLLQATQHRIFAASITMAFAVVQEYTQVWFSTRSLGRGEFFDLAVDLCAVAVAFALYGAGRRLRSTPPSTSAERSGQPS